MYLHIGQEIVVNQKEIIAVFDIETTSISKITRNFLKENENDGIIVNISDDLPKSVIVCTVMGSPVIYISPISSSTLLKRVNFISKQQKRDKKV